MGVKVLIIGAVSKASMRPEHGCSGNVLPFFRKFFGVSGFNEAGARMLRKWCSAGVVPAG